MPSAYKRILLKLSGEALMGDDKYGINRNIVEHIVVEITAVTQLGIEVAVVVGGGNIFRGMKSAGDGMDRVTARLYGDASHHHECACSPRCDEAEWLDFPSTICFAYRANS